MAAANISETVASEIARHQPEIDKAVREAMKDAKVEEQIAAELEKARPMIEKAAKEAEEAAAAEIAKHQPEIDKAVREAMKNAKVEEQIAAALEKTRPLMEKAAKEAEEAAARQLKIAEKQMPAQSFSMGESFKGLVFINEVESTVKELEKLNPDQIQVINVIKDKTAIDMYGERARGGVIKVTLKK